MKQAKRTPPPELVAIVEQQSIKTATVKPEQTTTANPVPTPAPDMPDMSVKPTKNVQLNFSCSEELMFTINEAAVKEGGIRPFIARVLKEAGYPVPDADLAGRTISRRMRA
jgi:hypothetical protein